jgi:poly(ADP-ribose) glycohydrolase ARH3
MVEGASPAMCERYVGDALNLGKAFDSGCLGYLPGQYTDDSQLARELMESFVDLERFDPPDYARRIAAIFRDNRIVGRGIASDQAARRLQRGTPWDLAGVPAPSAGNGTAMRAAPVGLFFFDRPEEMIRVARDQGWITHHDPRCTAGSIAIAGAVALCLHGRSLEVDSFTVQLSQWVRSLDPVLADSLLHLKQWIEQAPAEAGDAISQIGNVDDVHHGWHRISPFVTSSVLWSLYSFLRTPHDYWQSICTAIGVGGDVDSTAAMTGAVSGAFVGLEGIPSELARRIHDHGLWGYEDLVDLATECHQIVMKQRIG